MLGFEAHAGLDEAKQWVDKEFQPSTLSKEQQLEELRWFVNAAEPFKGMTIKVVSERIDTHWYEASVLAKAFYDITGIKVIHELTGEDDVVKKIQTQMDMDLKLYDAYINDSDLIGTHYRSQKVVALSDYMEGEGKDVTLPTLDLEDFMGLSFTTGPDGKLYQIPDQQFANLYWYRHDWFSRPDLQKQFKEIYGYDLGIPVNWSAYEDIAEFFSVHVKEIDGQRVYGHMDYGRKDPSIGWRFSDAWLSMAGAGDKGLPNGLPVDEWGIRMEDCVPVGASVERGGAANSPAAVYALTKFDEWLKKYAPPQAAEMNFTEAGALPGQGNIAQQIFWYTAFTAALTKEGIPVVNEDGTPKWRMAPSPHGVYWEKGMKLGYQDAGSWTLLKNTPPDRRKAAWLYAQFVISKTVSLKKTLVGLTPIRKSDINSATMTELAPKLGGLVEFYQSEARELWTPTGVNVPDYPLLSPAWWRTVPTVVKEGKTPQQAMDDLAEYLDSHMAKLATKEGLRCAPKLNEKKDREYWLSQPGSPKPKIANEKEPGKTVDFETALKQYER
ncbi:MAG: ABC transporter substrate-binding protein [Oleiphilaceae bacterium]|nr:ABC transporter substrate-binding protein [Oleiphilaceae bacterium]